MAETMSADDETQTWRKVGWVVLKFGAAGASLVAIAVTIVLVGAGGDVEETQALVWDMGTFEKSSTQKFASSLKHLGHTPPEVYDYNGNKVYFSRRHSRKNPDRLVREYQRTFVERGINDKMYEDFLVEMTSEASVPGSNYASRPNPSNGLSNDKKTAIRDEFEGLVTGEIVPRERTETMASMVGIVSKGDPETISEGAKIRREFVEGQSQHARLDRGIKLLRKCGIDGELESVPKAESLSPKLVKRQKIRVTAVEHKDLLDKCPEWQQFARRSNAMLGQAEREQLFQGFRSVRIRSPKGTDGSTVTAVWSDNEFDLNRAMSESETGQEPLFASETPAVPTCTSCNHISRFAENSSGTSYETNIFASQKSPDGVMQEYSSMLSSDGWKPSSGTRVLNTLFRRAGRGEASEYRLTEFSKGSSRVLIGAFPAESGTRQTHVTTMFESR
jgi:hypothetical protein